MTEAEKALLAESRRRSWRRIFGLSAWRSLWWSGPGVLGLAIVAWLASLAFGELEWLLATVSVLLVGLGALAVLLSIPDARHVLRAWVRRGKYVGIAARDVDWDPRGAQRDWTARAASYVLRHGPALVFLALPLMCSGGLVSSVLAGEGWAGVQLVGGAIAVYAVYRVFRVSAVGTVHVWWERFPLPLGGPIVIRFGVDASGSRIRRACFFIKCVVEQPRNLFGLQLLKVRHVRWLAGEARLDADAMPEAGSDLEIVFHPPRYVPETDLLARYRTFWELHVVGETSGGVLDETFLVPVYAASATAEAGTSPASTRT